MVSDKVLHPLMLQQQHHQYDSDLSFNILAREVVEKIQKDSLDVDKDTFMNHHHHHSHHQYYQQGEVDTFHHETTTVTRSPKAWDNILCFSKSQSISSVSSRFSPSISSSSITGCYECAEDKQNESAQKTEISILTSNKTSENYKNNNKEKTADNEIMQENQLMRKLLYHDSKSTDPIDAVTVDNIMGTCQQQQVSSAFSSVSSTEQHQAHISVSAPCNLGSDLNDDAEPSGNMGQNIKLRLHLNENIQSDIAFSKTKQHEHISQQNLHTKQPQSMRMGPRSHAPVARFLAATMNDQCSEQLIDCDVSRRTTEPIILKNKVLVGLAVNQEYHDPKPLSFACNAAADGNDQPTCIPTDPQDYVNYSIMHTKISNRLFTNVVVKDASIEQLASAFDTPVDVIKNHWLVTSSPLICYEPRRFVQALSKPLDFNELTLAISKASHSSPLEYNSCGLSYHYKNENLSLSCASHLAIKTGEGLYSTVLGNRPLSYDNRDGSPAYFEFHFLSQKQFGGICVGIALENTPLNKMVGHTEEGIGYYSSGSFVHANLWAKYGEEYTVGDTIGCLVRFSLDETTPTSTLTDSNEIIRGSTATGVATVSAAVLENIPPLHSRYHQQMYRHQHDADAGANESRRKVFAYVEFFRNGKSFGTIGKPLRLHKSQQLRPAISIYRKESKVEFRCCPQDMEYASCMVSLCAKE